MTTRHSINAADAAVSAQHPPVGREALSVNDVGRLLLRCAERPALVAAVTTSLTQAGANIVSLDQHSTKQSGGTFMWRNIFHLQGLTTARDARNRDFGPQAAVRFNMDFRLTEAAKPNEWQSWRPSPTTAFLNLIPYVEWLRLVIVTTQPRRDDLS
jgi:hypothetical protein